MGPFDDGGIDERMLDYFIRGSDIHSLRTVLCVTYAHVLGATVGTKAKPVKNGWTWNPHGSIQRYAPTPLDAN